MSSDPFGELDTRFQSTSFPGPLRRCQQLALDSFEKVRSSSRRQLHVVLPPGSGKTLLGLEIARRLGNPIIVLCPNTAIQAQWNRQWSEFQPNLVRTSLDSTDLAPLTILTYQAMAVLDGENGDLKERSAELWQASLQQNEGLSPEEATAQIEKMRIGGSPLYKTELARFRQKARKLVASGGDREELLGLLHPNGRRLLEQMKAQGGGWTLVLDECHHLLDLWGYLVRAFVQELGSEAFVVGLTATPPRELDTREQQLYRDIFEKTDFELPTPAAVKDGSLAPYQDLAYFTTPLPHELEYIEEQQSRFLKLLSRLLDQDFASVSFVQWVQERVAEHPSGQGRSADWDQFERNRPTLALAGLRFLYSYKLDLPEGSHIQERHRQELTADDWVALIEEFCLRHLKPSGDPRDIAAWEEIRRSLPSVGYVLTSQGVRSYVSTVDRVLSLSSSKCVAALQILAAEKKALGNELGALVLCDYEHAGMELVAKLRGVLDPQAGSAALLLRILLSDPTAASLNPILLTGRTVACSRATAYGLMEWLEERIPAVKGQLTTERLSTGADEQAGWEDLLVIRSSHSEWKPRLYAPAVTAYFEQGHCQCLVGTRGLLGEGWDAKRVNVLIDLTAATTSTAVHQSRGRSLRLDPRLPSKVADNWDVVCVAPGHTKGLSDYSRFVRKHRYYYAMTADGEIESGVSHVHPTLSPYGAPSATESARVNEEMLDRPSDRQTMCDRWAVGKPYQNQEIETLRVRMSRAWSEIKQPVETGKASKQRIQEDTQPGCWSVLWAILGLALASVAAIFTESAPLTALVAVAFPLAWLTRIMATPLRHGDATAGVKPIAMVVAEALHATDAISVGTGAVRVVPQNDGYYRCYLDGASAEESKLFSASLEEALSPLARPRAIMPRIVLRRRDMLGRWLGTFAVRLNRVDLRKSTGEAMVVYHNVPDYFSVNRARMNAFERSWRRRIGPNQPLYSHGNLAREIISVYGGQNPLEVSTQARTLWR